jgi:hypothetical protein
MCVGLFNCYNFKLIVVYIIVCFKSSAVNISFLMIGLLKTVNSFKFVNTNLFSWFEGKMYFRGYVYSLI